MQKPKRAPTWVSWDRKKLEIDWMKDYAQYQESQIYKMSDWKYKLEEHLIKVRDDKHGQQPLIQRAFVGPDPDYTHGTQSA